MNKKQPKPTPCEIEIPHNSYQPSREELRQDHREEATFEEIVAACLKPVKINYVMPRKRKR